jgi:hypothetical protein
MGEGSVASENPAGAPPLDRPKDCGCPILPQLYRVQFHDILYTLFRDILYTSARAHVSAEV